MNDLNELLTYCIDFLNQPSVKETIKNFCSSFTFAFGLVQLWVLFYRRKPCKNLPPLQGIERAEEIAQTCTSISLILSAACSRPSVYLLSSLCDFCLPADLFDAYFGPNTLFDLNPWHPRHVTSLIALGLALPSPIISLIHYVQSPAKASIKPVQQLGWMALFNTLTCRPVLHTGNQLGKLIFLRI
jgi:hypothetical protein